MTEVLHANVFFFITAIAVIAFTSLLCVALYHIIKLLKSVRRIVRRIEVGSEAIAEDMSHLRTYFKEGSFFSHIIGLLLKSQGSTKEKPNTKTARKRSADEVGKKRVKGTELSIHDVT
jgi:hypothetical protein